MGAWKKHGELERFHEKFVSGMLTGGFPLDFAERVFDQIRGFGEYGFPESHAASFALIAYATAWLKRFYPGAFTAALLNSQPMGFYAPAQLVADAREHGVEARPVDVNSSHWDCTLEPVKGRRARQAQDGALPAHWGRPGPALRLGFRLVKGLERAAAERIARAREAGGSFASLESCARRADLDKRALEALVAADAFAPVAGGRRAAAWEALGMDKKPPLFESVEFERFAPELDALSDGEQVVRDYESLGLSLRQHPMWFLRPELDAMGVRAAADVLTFPTETRVRVAGLVVTRQRPATASGVLFVSIEDETGSLQLIVPPQVFERDRLAARAATAVVAIGSVERQGEVVHVKTWKLWEITQMRRLQTMRHEFH
jgi:error-prone DNA polymerase